MRLFAGGRGQRLAKGFELLASFIDGPVRTVLYRTGVSGTGLSLVVGVLVQLGQRVLRRHKYPSILVSRRALSLKFGQQAFALGVPGELPLFQGGQLERYGAVRIASAGQLGHLLGALNKIVLTRRLKGRLTLDELGVFAGKGRRHLGPCSG